MISTAKHIRCPSRGSYQFVMRVPVDLQTTLGTKWVKRSLKTTNIKDAELILTSWLGKLQSSFSLLRTGLLNDEQTVAIKASISPSKRPSRKTLPKTLQKLIDLYVAECSPNWKKPTKLAFVKKLSVIVEQLGNRNVTSYTREDFLTYRNNLISEGLQPKTINTRLSLLSSLLKWGVRHGYLQHNHSEGMLLKLDKAPDEQRKVYAPEDLKRIMETLPRSSCCPWQYWIPMIAMYSGMRREEICQLRGCDIVNVKDISSGDEVWCFRITADASAGLTVKTESSSRIVPVHPLLVSGGLIDFIAGKQPESNLWDFKRYNSTGDYGKKFGNWYSEFNRKHITTDILKCFHSFRHTLANHLKQKGIQESLIAELLGHSSNNITMSRYGKRYQPMVLLEVISKVDYGVLTF